MERAKRYSIFVTSVTLMSLKPMLQHAAQDGGAAPLDPRFFAVLVEIFKIFFCLVMLTVLRVLNGKDSAKLWLGFKHTATYSIPACIFLAMNLLTVYGTSFMAPATFQLFTTTKIMTTAVVGRIILSRQLSWLKWAAVLLLTFGTALGQWSGKNRPGVLGTDTWGFLVVLMCTTLSAFGSVTTERLLKGPDNESLTIFATNAHMATHSIVMSIVYSVISSVVGVSEFIPQGRLTFMVFVACINEALNGILLSQIMRTVDSNAKNFASSLSVFTIAGVQRALFGYTVSPMFFLSACLVVFSIAMYARPEKSLTKES